jgi:hypothetical protein
MSILAFDLGIRNLAYCLVDSSGAIIDWNNYDLLAGTDSQSASRCSCGGPPSWTDLSGGLFCKKCVKKNKLLVLPLETITIKTLKELAEKEGGWGLARSSKKDDYIQAANSRYLMPYVKPKGATKTDLSIILDAINVFLDGRLELFAKCVEVRIENQPVFDNPTMKSVQIILFTLLTHRLKTEFNWTGSVVFVHASKKTEEAEDRVDKAGGNYKARKDTAELLVLEKLKDAQHSVWLEYFNSKKKKSDLADAFLMCLRLAK